MKPSSHCRDKSNTLQPHLAERAGAPFDLDGCSGYFAHGTALAPAVRHVLSIRAACFVHPACRKVPVRRLHYEKALKGSSHCGSKRRV